MLGIGADDYGLGERPTVWVPNWNGPQAVGLVFWVAARNGVLMDQKTGKIGIDTVSGGTRTRPLADVAPTGGLCGQSERFSYAAGAYFDFGLPGPLDGLTSCSISFWVFPLAIAGAWWGQGDGFSSSFNETGGNTGIFFRGAGDFRGIVAEVATVGAFQLLTWTADTSIIKYYRNGVLSGSWGAGLSGAISAAANNGIAVGGQPAGSGGVNDYSTARWADFRIYNRALTATEVYALYDPLTRWALYDTSVDYVWSDPIIVGGGTAVPVFYHHLTQQGIA